MTDHRRMSTYSSTWTNFRTYDSYVRKMQVKQKSEAGSKDGWAGCVGMYGVYYDHHNQTGAPKRREFDHTHELQSILFEYTAPQPMPAGWPAGWNLMLQMTFLLFVGN